MSYILDALKRADAERQREQGGPPDLLAPAAALGLAEAEEPTPAVQRWLWPAAALLLGALLAWGAAQWWRAEPAPAGPAALPAQPPPVAAAPQAAVAEPAPPPAPAAVPAPRMAEAPPLPLAKAPAPAVVASVPTPTVTPLPPPPPAAAAPTRLPKLAELPAAQRQGLPALSVGGSTHSDVATQRLLILNGAVLHEGDEAAPGLVLERIRQRSAVLRWQGQRFELDF